MKKKGFTLIEIIAVIAIMAIIGGTITSVFISSQKSFIRANNENIIQDEARVIIDAIETDIKNGKLISNYTDGTGEFSINTGAVTTNITGDFALVGESVQVKYLFSLKKNVGGVDTIITYGYLQVGNATKGNRLVKVKGELDLTQTSQTMNLVAEPLTKHLNTITIDRTTRPYKVIFQLEATPAKDEYRVEVTPRN